MQTTNQINEQWAAGYQAAVDVLRHLSDNFSDETRVLIAVLAYLIEASFMDQ